MTLQKPRLAPFSFFFFFFILAATAASAEEQIEFEGLIEPNEMVDIGTPVGGVVAHVNVKRSSSVTKGDALVLLDSSVENSVVNRARVLALVEGDLQLQKEKLAFAKRMYTRIQELFESEAISAEKHDQAKTEVTLAQARLQKAHENRELAKLDLQRAKAILNQRTIKSPISGIVVNRFVSPGEFVDSEPLLRIAQMNPLRVEVILPSKMFRKIKAGMKAEVIAESSPDESYDSTVAIVDRIIDPASGTFGVRLELPNPNYRLPSGLKCKVRFFDNDQIVSSAEQSNQIKLGKVAVITKPNANYSAVIE